MNRRVQEVNSHRKYKKGVETQMKYIFDQQKKQIEADVRQARQKKIAEKAMQVNATAEDLLAKAGAEDDKKDRQESAEKKEEASDKIS